MNPQRVIMLSLLFINSACTYTCKEVQDEFLELTDCNIVITENKSAGRNLNIKGYNPDTNSYVNYDETKGLLVFVYKAMVIGDTLFKPEKSDFLLLKKQKFNIKFYSACGSNGEYLGIKQDTVSKYSRFLKK
jgi:hypothetical protein